MKGGPGSWTDALQVLVGQDPGLTGNLLVERLLGAHVELISKEEYAKFGSGVHAFSVCDDPDYFYDYVQGQRDGLEAGVDSRDIVNIQNARAKGLGYGINTTEELKFVTEIAATTGIVLDPVYRFCFISTTLCLCFHLCAITSLEEDNWLNYS
ncbi:hypothetical protein GBA52_026225 [Prunus armeniaca]|nr:hypothetical protein GBA52_026225 [Prunus armeniaca]